MSLKSQSHFISPLTGKEVSKATYYRHVKKHFLECETEPGLERFQIQSQSQSKFDTPWYRDKTEEAIKKIESQFQSQHFDQEKENEERELRRKAYKFGYEQSQKDIKSQSQSQSYLMTNDDFQLLKDTETRYQQLHEAFIILFLAASSRGIPKRIVAMCQRWLITEN